MKCKECRTALRDKFDEDKDGNLYCSRCHMKKFLSKEEQDEVSHVLNTSALKGEAMFARSIIPGAGDNPFAHRGGGSLSPRAAASTAAAAA
eukprot:CAMPEP_0177674226 /NCGR_PEP_ID=MMETSP0447-20121125/26424_1 /TAXON_ID=0 /ORGANISM="Stygamoeba regulata, Strain BSH-02190019" /LENGTH=90 /DNA_ID=CAMNT_0019182271 /DNA_START=21 /DNA_END=290 /DNA_ORIENTATION=+